MEVTIIIKAGSPAERAAIKNALQNIAENFNKENVMEIARLSKLEQPNEKITSLFNNPLFKMAIR